MKSLEARNKEKVQEQSQGAAPVPAEEQLLTPVDGSLAGKGLWVWRREPKAGSLGEGADDTGDPRKVTPSVSE